MNNQKTQGTINDVDPASVDRVVIQPDDKLMVFNGCLSVNGKPLMVTAKYFGVIVFVTAVAADTFFGPNLSLFGFRRITRLVGNVTEQIR